MSSASIYTQSNSLQFRCRLILTIFIIVFTPYVWKSVLSYYNLSLKKVFLLIMHIYNHMNIVKKISSQGPGFGQSTKHLQDSLIELWHLDLIQL